MSKAQLRKIYERQARLADGGAYIGGGPVRTCVRRENVYSPALRHDVMRCREYERNPAFYTQELLAQRDAAREAKRMARREAKALAKELEKQALSEAMANLAIEMPPIPEIPGEMSGSGYVHTGTIANLDNPWQNHLRAVRAANPGVPGNEIMRLASASYRGGSYIGGARRRRGGCY